MPLRLTKNNEFLLASIFMLSNISGLLTELVDKIGLSYPTNIAFVIIFSISIIAWLKMLFINTKVVFSVATIYSFVLILSIMLEPQIQLYVFNFNNGSLYDFAKSEIVYVLLLCLSLFLLGFGRANIEVLFRYLRKYATASTIIFVVLMIVTILNGTQTYNYMSIAYNALPGICILFLDTKLYSKKMSVILCLLGIVGVFVGGCRGALATIFVLWLMWWLQTLKNISAQKLIKAILLSVVVMVVLINLPYFLGVLDKGLASVGYSSRIIESLITSSESEGFFSFDTRSLLQAEIANNLKLLGHGIYSDRVALDGAYPHNILLEIIYQFGWFLGIIIMIGGICVLIHIYRIASRKNNKHLMAALLFLSSIICAKLMVSSTYLSDLTFWFGVGFVNICLRNTNQRGDKQI